MITHKRNTKIIDLHDKGCSFNEIAVAFKITPERVRQIVTQESNYCLRHNTSFSGHCQYCVIESEYKRTLLQYTIKQMSEEAIKLSKLGRRIEDIAKKRIFVNTMRNKFGYSFSGIGRMLKKHHSTIINLYQN